MHVKRVKRYKCHIFSDKYRNSSMVVMNLQNYGHFSRYSRRFVHVESEFNFIRIIFSLNFFVLMAFSTAKREFHLKMCMQKNRKMTEKCNMKDKATRKITSTGTFNEKSRRLMKKLN